MENLGINVTRTPIENSNYSNKPENDLKEVEITYEELFNIIENEENVTFELNKEYFQTTPIMIKDEVGYWRKVLGLIKKKDKVVKITCENDIEIICSLNHLLVKKHNDLIFANEIKKGDELAYVNDKGFRRFVKVLDIEELNEERELYDLEIDNPTHLYQTANGIIHHNTLLTAAIVKYANDLNMRSITIVPSSSLLQQTYDYLKQFDIEVGMYGGGIKEGDKQNIVATWQTLQKEKQKMREFQCVIWDEAHGCKSYVAQQIMNEATNSFMRLGLTGTIPKDKLDQANLTAAFGPVIYEVKASDLQKRNILASININVLKLNYPKDIKNSFVDWNDETNFLQVNEYFYKVMKAILSDLKGNTLILMKNVKPASELAKYLNCDFISSSLSLDKRKEKFNEFVFGGNITKVGTYSLLSTGIDIVHINNLILAPTPGKSFVKTIQSIGRGLRRKEGEKEHVEVFDFTSNLKYDQRHSRDRLKYYEEAGYPYKTIDLDLDQLFNK